MVCVPVINTFTYSIEQIEIIEQHITYNKLVEPLEQQNTVIF